MRIVRIAVSSRVSFSRISPKAAFSSSVTAASAAMAISRSFSLSSARAEIVAQLRGAIGALHAQHLVRVRGGLAAFDLFDPLRRDVDERLARRLAAQLARLTAALIDVLVFFCRASSHVRHLAFSLFFHYTRLFRFYKGNSVLYFATLVIARRGGGRYTGIVKRKAVSYGGGRREKGWKPCSSLCWQFL